MPRGKRFAPEDAPVPGAVIIADVEQTAKAGAAKVTLVKSMQAEEEHHPASATGKKRSARPKVGRASGVRKTESEDKAVLSGKAEKKEGKSRIQQESPPPAQETDRLREKSHEEEMEMDSPTAGQEIAPAPLHIEPLRQEPVFVESTPGWSAEHARPWSFRSILVGVALFVLVNLSFMSVFSAHRQPAAPISAPVPASRVAHAPAAASPHASVVSAVKPGSPAAMQRQPAAPAAGSAIAAPSPAKAGNLQELLSIISRN